MALSYKVIFENNNRKKLISLNIISTFVRTVERDC